MDEFLHHYVEILTDPAHLAVEISLMLIVDVLFLGFTWPWIKRHIHRDIAEVDSDVAGTPVVWDGEHFRVGDLVVDNLVGNDALLASLKHSQERV